MNDGNVHQLEVMNFKSNFHDATLSSEISPRLSSEQLIPSAQKFMLISAALLKQFFLNEVIFTFLNALPRDLRALGRLAPAPECDWGWWRNYSK